MPYKKTIVKSNKSKTFDKKVKDVVKKVMESIPEVKIAEPDVNLNVHLEFFPATTGPIQVANLLGFTNNLVQGTGQSGRIGNKVKTNSYDIQYIINYMDGAGAITPRTIRVIIMRLKAGNAEPDWDDMQEFFQNGDSSVPPDNTYADLLRTVNRDAFTVYYDKIHKIGLANGNIAPPSLAFANNDFKYSVSDKVNLKSHVRGLEFNDNSVTPSKHGVYMIVLGCYSDGSAFSSSDRIANLNYITHYSFTDM